MATINLLAQIKATVHRRSEEQYFNEVTIPMTPNRQLRLLLSISALLTGMAILLAHGATAHGQNTQGVITGRNGATMTLQTQDASKWALPIR